MPNRNGWMRVTPWGSGCDPSRRAKSSKNNAWISSERDSCSPWIRNPRNICWGISPMDSALLDNLRSSSWCSVWSAIHLSTCEWMPRLLWLRWERKLSLTKKRMLLQRSRHWLNPCAAEMNRIESKCMWQKRWELYANTTEGRRVSRHIPGRTTKLINELAGSLLRAEVRQSLQGAVQALLEICRVHTHDQLRMNCSLSLALLGPYLPQWFPNDETSNNSNNNNANNNNAQKNDKLTTEKIIDRLECIATEDTNRYVKSYCLLALERVNTIVSKNRLIKLLWTARWCPITNPNSQF